MKTARASFVETRLCLFFKEIFSPFFGLSTSSAIKGTSSILVFDPIWREFNFIETSKLVYYASWVNLDPNLKVLI